MNKTNTIFLFLFLTLVGCTPTVKSRLQNTSFPPLASADEVIVLTQGESVPQNSSFVGNLKIGDSGFSTDCGYETVMENAKKAAQKSGANIIELTEVKVPSMASTCYRIKAKLYRNTNQADIDKLLAARQDQNKSRLPVDADYAVIYFYRPISFVGSAIGYKIRLEDRSIIGRVRNGEKFAYRTKVLGPQSFWAITESSDSIEINVERGEEYFVRCSIVMGAMVGRPKLEMVENYIGLQEYTEVPERTIDNTIAPK